MNDVVISIGSNIEPEKNVPAALEVIAASHRIIARSAVVRTSPIGPPGQPDYLNGVVRIETTMEREELKEWLTALEDRLGRVRGPDKFAPRTIDFDIVVWNGRIVHEDVRRRDFLRRAVQDVWSNLSRDYTESTE